MSLQAEVTAQIVAQLEAGVRPWNASWDQEGSLAMPRRSTGEQYTGVNVLLLWAAAMEKGFRSAQWMTFQQAKDLGGSVRKGSKGSKVVYASTFTKEVEGEEQEIPFMKAYTVFNVEQIDGLPERFYAKPRAASQAERIVAADDFFMKTGVQVRHGGGKAFYSPGHDFIQMPELSRFDDAPAYYATLAHELTHATGHKDRLDRSFNAKRFGDEGYAMEELVAEMGAAFVMAELGLSASPREDHASYLAGWIKVLKADCRAIFTAASYASKAVAKLREMVAAFVPPVAPAPAPTSPRKPRKAAPKASRSNVVAMVPKAPVAAPSRVAAELEKTVKVAKRSKRVGDFRVTWADGSETRVTGVLWSKDGDAFPAAYQAADRLRRLRARHTIGEGVGSIGWATQEVRNRFARPLALDDDGSRKLHAYFSECAGIRQLSPAYWAAVAAHPMAAPVRIELEGSTLAWGEMVKLAA